jgi:hypothetical protein
MKKFRWLAAAATLALSAWVHAETPQFQDRNTAAGAAFAAFDAGAARPRTPDGASGQPYRLEAVRDSSVPEPEGWTMMLLGAGLVAYQVRRRKHARAKWDLR